MEEVMDVTELAALGRLRLAAMPVVLCPLLDTGGCGDGSGTMLASPSSVKSIVSLIAAAGGAAGGA